MTVAWDFMTTIIMLLLIIISMLLLHYIDELHLDHRHQCCPLLAHRLVANVSRTYF